jgi:hypothetical protein
MEARAHARLGDARACDLALADAVAAFERRHPDDDPEWIRYFDDSELAAEFGHCSRDLARAGGAVGYATEALGALGVSSRSDFFVTMVLADAHAAAGDIDEAVRVTAQALDIAAGLSSARTTTYMREFRTRLDDVATLSTMKALDDQFADFSLWGAGAEAGSRRI